MQPGIDYRAPLSRGKGASLGSEAVPALLLAPPQGDPEPPPVRLEQRSQGWRVERLDGDHRADPGKDGISVLAGHRDPPARTFRFLRRSVKAERFSEGSEAS